MNLKDWQPTKEQLEAARFAIETELIWRRDDCIAVLRNNGLCIKSRDGEPSSIIRMGAEEAFKIGLKAIQALEDRDAPLKE